MKIEQIEFIHYGAKEYDPSKFKPVSNRFAKPKGGLWGSPVDSEWGWKEWCEAESFADCNEGFRFKLKKGSKVFIIDSYKDMMDLPFKCYSETEYQVKYLDYESSSRKYDAIWLTEKGQVETQFSEPVNLYGWDCESILVMNPDPIITIIANKYV